MIVYPNDEGDDEESSLPWLIVTYLIGILNNLRLRNNSMKIKKDKLGFERNHAKPKPFIKIILLWY